MVDENSILVFESQTSHESLKSLIHPFTKAENEFLISLQRKTKTEVDLVIIFKSNPAEFDSLTNKKLLQSQKIKNRIYEGFRIYEWKSSSNHIFSFSNIEGVTVLSKNSLLVENAIRVFKNKLNIDFKERNAPLFEFALLKNDLGNLYINFSQLSGAISIIPPSLLASPYFESWNNKAVFDFIKSDSHSILNGFAIADDTIMSYLQHQRPVSINIFRFITGNSNALLHFGISDLQRASKKSKDTLEVKNIISEFAIVNEEDNENLYVIAGLQNESIEKLEFTSSDYSESYSGYQIQRVNQRTLKDYYSRFLPDKEFGFGFIKDDYLLMAHSAEDLKQIIDAIESEDTWSKTLDFQSFNEKCLQESNVSLFIKKPKIISDVIDSSEFLNNLSGLSKVKWGALQYSALDKNFYASIAMSFDDDSDTQKPDRKIESRISTSSLKHNHAYEVRNLNKAVLLVQETDNKVSMISPETGMLWNQMLTHEVTGEIFQIDYFKNGKYQFLIPAGDNLHLIDRLGRPVTGFPKKVAGSLQHMSIVDYDKSKNYRYLVSTHDNKLYLLDKDGNNLDEWGPKSFGTAPVIQAEHFKVAGKDYFVTVLKDGKVLLFNRKGDEVISFQLPKRDFVSGECAFISNKNIASSELFAVDRDGEVVKYSMEGKILSRFNLIRGNQSVFKLIRVPGSNKFNFVRVDADKLAVFNSDGKILFEKQNSGSIQQLAQIIERHGKLIFCFFDQEQKICYLYDQTGKELITPFESEIIPVFGKINSSRTLTVYAFPQNAITLKNLDF